MGHAPPHLSDLRLCWPAAQVLQQYRQGNPPRCVHGTRWWVMAQHLGKGGRGGKGVIVWRDTWESEVLEGVGGGATIGLGKEDGRTILCAGDTGTGAW